MFRTISRINHIFEILPSSRITRAIHDTLSILTRPKIVWMQPSRLQIEIITRCNLACIMCPRTVGLKQVHKNTSRDVWFQQMGIDQFRAIVQRFPHAQIVSLHGIGEPLMHPHIYEMVEIGAQLGMQVGFTTNGTLLSEPACTRLLDAGIANLIISLDGATAATYEAIRVHARFDTIITNIRTLMEIRYARHQTKPKVTLAMVVSRRNSRETSFLVKLAHTLGVDDVLLSPVLPAEPGAELLMCSTTEWTEATQEARAAAYSLGIRLHVRGGGESVSGGPKSTKMTHRCLAPWFETVVTLNGDVMPCCNIHHPVFSMGNTFDKEFIKIWNGEKYRSFRTELRNRNHTPEPCQWCPDF